jgi:hypothetical protein
MAKACTPRSDLIRGRLATVPLSSDSLFFLSDGAECDWFTVLVLYIMGTPLPLSFTVRAFNLNP